MERENHEWMEGWMEQIINGWKNERIEKIMDDRKNNYGLMEKFMDGWMDRWKAKIHGWLKLKIDGWMERKRKS